jgi:Zn-finger domain-containing protein
LTKGKVEYYVMLSGFRVKLDSFPSLIIMWDSLLIALSSTLTCSSTSKRSLTAVFVSVHKTNNEKLLVFRSGDFIYLVSVPVSDD